MSWLIPTICVVITLAIAGFFAWRNTRRQIRDLQERRSNPARDEFLAMMEADVSPEAAAFLWDTALIYLRPGLTPHPDDNLAIDLPILEEDWILDWPRDFAREQGLVESNLPDWPEGWQPTVRNYGRWLSLGLTG